MYILFERPAQYMLLCSNAQYMFVCSGTTALPCCAPLYGYAPQQLCGSFGARNLGLHNLGIAQYVYTCRYKKSGKKKEHFKASKKTCIIYQVSIIHILYTWYILYIIGIVYLQFCIFCIFTITLSWLSIVLMLSDSPSSAFVFCKLTSIIFNCSAFVSAWPFWSCCIRC